MKPEWIEYTGSDEQIDEMKNATNGFVFRYKFKTGNIEQSQTYNVLWNSMLQTVTAAYITHYLICEPNPNADMICQQARTGQPVWVRIPVSYERYGYCYITYGATTTPDWNIPGAEYSFEPFEEEL